jgi:hypothetical protein
MPVQRVALPAPKDPSIGRSLSRSVTAMTVFKKSGGQALSKSEPVTERVVTEAVFARELRPDLTIREVPNQDHTPKMKSPWATPLGLVYTQYLQSKRYRTTRKEANHGSVSSRTS